MMKKMITITLAVVMLLTMLFTACDSGKEIGEKDLDTSDKVVSESGEKTLNDLTALELSRLMGNGINLGNTMEPYGHSSTSHLLPSSSFERLWGQPITTKAMVDGMKAAGFDTLRIPVSWTNGMAFEEGDYTISDAVLNRVGEIINYALDNDMFVIVNDHWDGGWWGMFGSASEETRAKAMEMYVSMWTQIGTKYGDYSHKLIFESANEELGDRLNDKDKAPDSGSLSTSECYEMTNEINSTFVKTIRSLGGNNADRFLLIASYNTDIMRTIDDRFKMPEDTATDKLLLSVHYYTPSNYTMEEGISNWGTVRDYEEMNTNLEKLTKFTDDGYGIIIGEYGALPINGKLKEGADRYTNNVLDICDYYGFVPVLWDTGGLFKRTAGVIEDETMAEIFKTRSYSSQAALTEEEEKSQAKTRIDENAANAVLTFDEKDIIIAGDDTAVAWIMYSSADFSVTYSVGDVYNPASKTKELIANDIVVDGTGTYTVSLDFTKTPKAKGTSFCALGIANGETLFPGYIVNIDEIKINGEVFTAEGEYYTASDDGITTRVNLYNGWISTLPDDIRTNGDAGKASAQNLKLGKQGLTKLEVTFTYAPAD